MELSKRVDHPNIARTLDDSEDDGVYFLVMEYVSGDSLYNIVKAGNPLQVPDPTVTSSRSSKGPTPRTRQA